MEEKDRCFPNERSSSHLMKEVIFIQREIGYVDYSIHFFPHTLQNRWLHNLLFCLLQQPTH